MFEWGVIRGQFRLGNTELSFLAASLFEKKLQNNVRKN
jgi:hypothetical protein